MLFVSVFHPDLQKSSYISLLPAFSKVILLTDGREVPFEIGIKIYFSTLFLSQYNSSHYKLFSEIRKHHNFFQKFMVYLVNKKGKSLGIK